jgi:hypothetical protein
MFAPQLGAFARAVQTNMISQHHATNASFGRDSDDVPQLKIVRKFPGRALLVGANSRLHISNRYRIFHSDDLGETWNLNCYIPSNSWKSYAATPSLAARLLRFYIASFHVLDDGSRVAVARDGIYRASPGEQRMHRTFKITRGSRPLNLSVDRNRVMFGEYGSGLENSRVAIYISEDYGKSFSVGYLFPQGDIRHVHNIVIDKIAGLYWVLVGDFEQQPGIGILSDDLSSIHWIRRGTQQCRAVCALPTKDGLIYGTDSDRERNFIVMLDRKDGNIRPLCEIEGSSLYATDFGAVKAIATCVEPNPHCPSKTSALYLSHNGISWTRSLCFQKDWFHPRYFQFGTLVLPPAKTSTDHILLSGQGLRGLDNTSLLIQCGLP